MKSKQILFLLALSWTVFPAIASAQEEKAVKFGFYVDRGIVASRTLVLNEALTERISEIGNRIADVSGRRDLKYTFRVINDPIINAYSASGGFIYINTGLLDILQSEDELAGILGHEIAHTNLDHQIGFIRKAHESAMIGSIFGTLAGAALGAGLASAASSYATQRMAMDFGQQVGDLLSNALATAMVEGYGKDQELQADASSVRYSRNAGYDPMALVSVFKRLISIRNRLETRKGSYASALVNAEPGLEERAKKLEAANSKEK
jgi:predicted Zn-dependent protease